MYEDEIGKMGRVSLIMKIQKEAIKDMIGEFYCK